MLLTIGAWGLTLAQTRTMEMGMGGAVQGAPPEAMTDAMTDAMGGMGETGAMDGGDQTTPSGTTGMAAMGEGAWSPGGLTAFVAAWTVMMVAMMLPAVAPMLLLYRTIAGTKQADGGAFVSTWILVAGYVLVWTAVGLGAYVLTRLGDDLAGRLGATARQTWAPLVLGTILVAAGLYQFTPLKHACLRQCQSPFGFVMGHWHDGRTGALRMGVVHGAYCLGCCWALFAVLVAAGAMSLAWMLLLTLVVFAEKVFPFGRQTALAVGLVFIALGLLVASGLMRMPGVA